MKKPKLSFGPGGIKGFLAIHVEKLVLGLVMLLVAWFLYSGYRLEGYKAERTPSNLRMQTKETTDYVLRNTAVARVSGDAERAIIENHKSRAEKSQMATSGGDYPMIAINQPNFPNKKKRGDVKILTPEMVEVRPFLTSLYSANETGNDPYAADTNPVVGSTAKKGESKKKDDGSGASGGLPPALGEGGAAPAAGDAGKKKGGKSGQPGMGSGGKSGPPGVGSGGKSGPPGLGSGGKSGPPGGASGPGVAGGSSGMSGSGMGMGGSGGGSGTDDYVRRYVDWTPKRGGGMPGQNQMPGGNTGGPVGKTQYVVSILAYVPHEKMVDEYTDLFADSMDYEPARDAAPRYAGVFVDRAEIPDDPNAPLEWVRVRRSDYEKRFREWPMTMPEIADERYVDSKITFALPPAMLVDPVKFGLHSQIPQANSLVEQSDAGTAPARQGDEGSYDENAPFAAGGAQNNPGFGGAAGGGALGGGGLGGSGASGPPGGFGGAGGSSGRPGGGMGSGPPGGSAGMGSSGRPGGGMGSGPPGGMGGGRMGSGPPGGMGGGMSGGGMSGGGMSGGGMSGGGMSQGQVAQSSMRPTKYKMVRFFDFDAEPGKKYKYRVKLLVEDPNNPNPEGGLPAPADRYLDTTVVARIKDAKKRWWLESEWSKESSSVSLPAKVSFVAGPVENVNYQGVTEPSGKLIAVTWDDSRAVRIPGIPTRGSEAPAESKSAVFRGTLLNFVSKEARVFRPDTLEVKGVKDYSTVTDALVLDMRFGVEIVSNNLKAARDRDRKPLRSGSEFLLLDRSGNLIVHDELDDLDKYREYTLDGIETQGSGSGAGGAAGGDGGAAPGLGGLGAGSGGGAAAPSGGNILGDGPKRKK